MFFFFFKLKTAYEMRISDWSSDVCSSDLKTLLSKHMLVNPLSMLIESKKFPISVLHRTYIDERALVTTPYHRALNRLREAARGADCHGSRPAARRVGKGCVSTVRTRWTPYHKKNKKRQKITSTDIT